jgi:hypothetical protein
VELDRGCLVDTVGVVGIQEGWVEAEASMDTMDCLVDINRDPTFNILVSADWEDTGCNLRQEVCMDLVGFRDKEARESD